MRVVRFKEEMLSGYLEISVHIFECFFNGKSNLRGFFRRRLSVGISHPGIKSLRGKIYMICSRIDTFYFCWFVFWKPRRFKGYFVNVVVDVKSNSSWRRGAEERWLSLLENLPHWRFVSQRCPPPHHLFTTSLSLYQPSPPLHSSLLGGGWWGGRSHQYPRLHYWRSPPSTSWRTELLMEFRGGRRRSNRQRGECVPASGSLQSIPRRWLSISRAVLPLNLTELGSH